MIGEGRWLHIATSRTPKTGSSRSPENAPILSQWGGPGKVSFPAARGHAAGRAWPQVLSELDSVSYASAGTQPPRPVAGLLSRSPPGPEPPAPGAPSAPPGPAP